LNKNAVDGIVGVQLPDYGQQLLRGSPVRKRQLPAVNAEPFARLGFHVDVGRGRGIVAYQNNSQARVNAILLQVGDLTCNFAFDLVRDRSSVDEFCSHIVPTISQFFRGEVPYFRNSHSHLERNSSYTVTNGFRFTDGSGTGFDPL
jgi:hypothetical protein